MSGRTTCLIEYKREDYINRLHFWCSPESLEFLKECIERSGFNCELREFTDRSYTFESWEATQRILDSLYSVQGKTRGEGESIIPAIESLICAYAALK